MAGQSRARRTGTRADDAVERIASTPERGAVAEPAELESSPTIAPPNARPPRTARELVALVDEGWREFRAAAYAFPGEHMDERIGDEGWTRKQMLAHITAWHDLANERLLKLISTGERTELKQDADTINARVARQAVGRTAGEVLKDMELSFNRLRRQAARLTDDQLAAFDGWAAQIVAGNTYEHYDEHADDVNRVPAGAGGQARR